MAEWQWQLELTDNDTRKSNQLAVALGVAAAVCIGIAVVTAARYWIVLAFMVATICFIGRQATTRLRTLQAHVDGPVLTLQDKRETTTIDLRNVETIELRERNSRTAQRWVLEAAGDGVVTVHQLPVLEGYLALDEQSLLPLRSAIEHYHQWYRGQAPSAAPTSSAAEAATAVMAPVATESLYEPAVVAGASAGAPVRPRDDFEWRPPLHPNAERNRRRVLISTLVIAAAIAAIAVQQNWGDLVGILLSVAVVPGIVLLLGLGCWYAYTPGQKFRLSTTAGQLQVWRGDTLKKTVPLAGATDLVVDVSHNRNHQTNTNSSHTYVRVVTASGSEQILLPSSLGVHITPEERVRLERALRLQASLG